MKEVKKLIKGRDTLQSFLQEWGSLLNSKTIQYFYNTAWPTLQEKWNVTAPDALEYIKETRIHHKEKIVRCWTDQHSHLNIIFASRLKVAHFQVRKFIRQGHEDLVPVQMLEKLYMFPSDASITRLLDMHFRELCCNLVRQSTHTPTKCFRHPFCKEIILKLSHYAIEAMLDNYENTSTAIDEAYEKIHGIPCGHRIRTRVEEGGVLSVDDFHKQWHLRCDGSLFFNLEDDKQSSNPVKVTPVNTEFLIAPVSINAPISVLQRVLPLKNTPIEGPSDNIVQGLVEPLPIEDPTSIIPASINLKRTLKRLEEGELQNICQNGVNLPHLRDYFHNKIQLFLNMLKPIRSILFNKRLQYTAFIYETGEMGIAGRGYSHALSLLQSLPVNPQPAKIFAYTNHLEPFIYKNSMDSPEFTTLMQDTIKDSKDELVYLLSSRAKRIVSGYLPLVDERAELIYGRAPECDDTIGMCHVEDGIVLPATYIPMPTYRFLSPTGIFSLPKPLFIKVMNKLQNL